MTFYIAISILAFMLSLVGTRVAIITWRKRARPVDVASLRAGKQPPVRGGGIILVFTLIICLLASDISYGIILSLLLLTAISALDDLIGVPLAIRLLVQIMAVTVPLSMTDVPLFGGILPPWIDKMIAAGLWIGFINMFRAMDDVDGLSTVGMMSVGGGVSLLAVFAGTFPDALSIYGLIIATAGCGFLWWNWPPAKITLGSVGTMPIGFFIGYLLLLAAISGYPHAALILPAYYVCDTLLTWIPHGLANKHDMPRYYYHKALKGGRTQATVVRYIIGINILLIFLALRSQIDKDLAAFHLALAYGTAFVLLSWFTLKKTKHHDH